MADRYADMTIIELMTEVETWERILDAPKGPGKPGNGARHAAEAEMYRADAWLQRKRMEQRL